MIEPFRDGIQIAFDATTLKLIETCEFKYKLRQIDRWTARRKSVHLLFGGWFAKALEHYYKYVASGDPSSTALRKVVHETLIATWEYNLDDQGERIPGTGHPWLSDHNTKTRENLIRTIIWYVDQFENESLEVVLQANGKPAVEYTFAFEVDNGNLFCGHIDRLVKYSGEYYIMDQKTTGSTVGPYYFEDFSPDTQMSMYTYAGQLIYQMPVKGIIIDAAQIAVGFSRFERGFTFRSKSELNEWYDDSLAHIENIQKCTRENHFPKRTTSCGNYGGCEFRGICSRSPEVREQFLKGDFVKGEAWNPLRAR